MKDIVLVDGMNLVFRMYHVNKHLATKKGVKTGVLYGVLRSIPLLRKKLADCSIVWCWEGGVALPGTPIIPSWRKALVETYKAGRKPNPDLPDILAQLNKAIKILTVLGYPKAYLPGLEADDLIGILSSILSEQGKKVYILTADRDMFQCIDKNTTVVRPGKDGLVYYTPKKVLNEFSVPTDKWAQYKALVGDSSDNYKGVAGVGPVKAARMIADGVSPEFLSWDTHPTSVQKKYPELAKQWEEAHRCYKLSQIPRSVTFPLFSKEVRASLKENMSDVLRALDNSYNKATFAADLEKWTKFCVEHELSSFLADRRQFFAFR